VLSTPLRELDSLIPRIIAPYTPNNTRLSTPLRELDSLIREGIRIGGHGPLWRLSTPLRELDSLIQAPEPSMLQGTEYFQLP